MRTALVIGGRPDYAGPAVRILPRTRARIYPSGHDDEAEVEFSINNNDQEQQLKLMSLRAPHTAAISRMPEVEVARGLVPYTCCRFRKGSNERGASSSEGRPPFRW